MCEMLAHMASSERATLVSQAVEASGGNIRELARQAAELADDGAIEKWRRQIYRLLEGRSVVVENANVLGPVLGLDTGLLADRHRAKGDQIRAGNEQLREELRAGVLEVLQSAQFPRLEAIEEKVADVEGKVSAVDAKVALLATTMEAVRLIVETLSGQQEPASARTAPKSPQRSTQQQTG